MNLMQLLLTNLKNEQAILAGLTNSLSDSLTTCSEECDSENLKQENYDLLMQTLDIIHKITHSSATELPSLNEEQVDHLLNNCCGAVQVFLVRTGPIKDEMSESIVNLCLAMFQTFGRVTVGGLLILNGLINAIGGDICKYLDSVISFVTMAISMEHTDAMGQRLAIGFISDVSNHC